MAVTTPPIRDVVVRIRMTKDERERLRKMVERTNKRRAPKKPWNTAGYLRRRALHEYETVDMRDTDNVKRTEQLIVFLSPPELEAFYEVRVEPHNERRAKAGKSKLSAEECLQDMVIDWILSEDSATKADRQKEMDRLRSALHTEAREKEELRQELSNVRQELGHELKKMGRELQEAIDAALLLRHQYEREKMSPEALKYVQDMLTPKTS